MHALTLVILAASGIDLEGMGKSIAPGDDFNAYCSGTWLENTQIPPDLTSYGLGPMMAEQTRQHTRELIEGAAKTDPQVAEYYATFMDEAGIEKKGLEPLKPGLAAVAAIADKKALATALGKAVRADVDALNATNFYTPHLLGLWVVQALDDPQHNTPYLMQGGLTMPDREYYLSKADDMAALRRKHQAYVAQLLKLAGLSDPDTRAGRVAALELKIAQTHSSRIDSEKVENAAPWKKEEIAKNAPGLDWAAFLAAARLDAPRIYMWQPNAVRGLAALVGSEPLDAWKDWLVFHLVDERAPFLPKAFVDANFEFHGKALMGVPQQKDRWKRGVNATNNALGEAVGKLYAMKYFSPLAKQKAQEMVNATIKAFVKRIDALTWMAPATRAAAKDKVATLRVGVGYPDTWRDYSGLKVVKGDALGNFERAELFEYEHVLGKIGKPVDRGEWWMTPQTFDALNMPLQNSLNFPAALLQPPLFDPDADPAINFGATGATFGHEISHSFDDTGSQFDSLGMRRNWWTPEDFKKFTAEGERLAAQFDKYEPLPGVHVNGHQTLGENIADVAGLAAAYDAYKETVGKKSSNRSQTFSGDQLFFIAYGQSWREKKRDEVLKNQLITDGHAPETYRCDTVRNVDGWYTAFGVKAGQKLFLAPADRVRVW
jgi:predicted metalloendopeptidase